MYVYCVRELGLDIEKVNVNGGAIALGHPLDMCFHYTCMYSTLILARSLRCTGARQIATGLNALEHRGGKVCLYFLVSYGKHLLTVSQILVTSMCIGTGMGAAAVFVRD